MSSRHQYGHHQPQGAPNAVTVLSDSAYGRPVEQVRELPAELVKQRRDINELAHRQGQGEGTMHDCTASDREVWLPADPTRDGGSWCPLCHTAVVPS